MYVIKCSLSVCLTLQTDPLEPGLRFLPIFYACTIVVNFFSIFYDGPESEHSSVV